MPMQYLPSNLFIKCQEPIFESTNLFHDFFQRAANCLFSKIKSYIGTICLLWSESKTSIFGKKILWKNSGLVVHMAAYSERPFGWGTFESLTWEPSALPSSSKAHPFMWSQIEKFYHIQVWICVRGSTGYNDTVSAINTSFDTGMLKQEKIKIL